jgi:hypothetical protein
MEKGWIMYNFSIGIPSYFLRFNNMPRKRRKTPDLCNHSFLALVPLEFAFAKIQFAFSQVISVDLMSSMRQIKWEHLIACSVFNPNDTGKETQSLDREVSIQMLLLHSRRLCCCLNIVYVSEFAILLKERG